ncbi:hypothetical protein [Methanobrevibacter sp.]
MNRKIMSLIIVLIFSLCCISIAFAQNDTIEDIESNDSNIETEDLSNYILPISISNGKIEFNDGFTGFALDSSKDKISEDDTFSPGEFSYSQSENYVKSAIIESYKQGRENDIANIVSKIIDGNLDTQDSVIKEVLSSEASIGDSEVVSIDNTTEATFTFELLKSTNEEKSDCLAYKVSLKTVEAPDILNAGDDGKNNSNDDNATLEDNDKQSTDTGEDKAANDDKDKKSQDSQKNTEDNDNEKSAVTNASDNQKNDNESKANDTTVNETNTTIVKTTTTVIENNTTIVHNNVKEVNNTTAPENDTLTSLLKAGNPILILIIVIAVAVIAVVIMKRKE